MIFRRPPVVRTTSDTNVTAASSFALRAPEAGGVLSELFAVLIVRAHRARARWIDGHLLLTNASRAVLIDVAGGGFGDCREAYEAGGLGAVMLFDPKSGAGWSAPPEGALCLSTMSPVVADGRSRSGTKVPRSLAPLLFLHTFPAKHAGHLGGGTLDMNEKAQFRRSRGSVVAHPHCGSTIGRQGTRSDRH